MNRTHSLAILLAVALTAGLLPAASATAQTDDHLKCYRVRDEKSFRSADVDVDALVVQFGLEACRVSGGAKEFCVPATKTVTEIVGGSLVALDGDAVRYSRLCYKLKCPKTELAPEVVTDQFGQRSISKFKAVKLCTPAVLASAPVTTTTTISTTTTSTTTTSTTTSTTLSLDDDFESGSLDPSWTVLNGGLATVEVSDGALRLTPNVGGGTNMWFNDGEAVLVYKEVTGDFDVRAVMSSEDTGNLGSAVPPQYQLGGILARDPASTSGDRNTVHVALGSGSTGQGTSYEYKSTDGSVSDWATTPTALHTGEVRLTRVGTTVTMYWRETAPDAWLEIQNFVRADLPATLQVGLMAYSFENTPAIRASFEEVVFDVP
jgi:hypothetical protein